MTWLLVEDDNDIRNVVAVMMSVWGEKPLPFPDGTSTWAWLDTVANGTFTGELPELALMDIRMPGYTGDKVAARIRQMPALKDIPIILMTAFSLTDSEIKDMMDQSGIDHLINKPLPDMEVFRTTLYRVRDERQARAAKQQQLAETSKVETPAPMPPMPPMPPVPTTPAAPTAPPSSTSLPVQPTLEAAKEVPSVPSTTSTATDKPLTPAAPAAPPVTTPTQPPAQPVNGTPPKPLETPKPPETK